MRRYIETTIMVRLLRMETAPEIIEGFRLGEPTHPSPDDDVFIVMMMSSSLQ